MEWNVKKGISLNRFFMIFLAHAVFSFLCAGILWAFLITLSSYLHITIPANALEQSISKWRDSLDQDTVIIPDEIPSGADYAIFDRNGNLLQTNLDQDTLKTATDMAFSANQTDIKRSGPSIGSRIYLRLTTDTQCVIIIYRLITSFRPPLLQWLFPNAELFFLLLLFVMLIADLVWIAVRYARKLNKELQKLAAAADQISKQNLVFEIQLTKLAEFNRIMDSLDRLRTDLQHSLKEQWAMEQQKKRQLTALTHDIKTPLAIITGNAELLSETSQTPEQQEYTSYILEHARQIHRYVTGILELSRPDDAALVHTCIKDLLSTMTQMAESLGKKKRLSCSFHTEGLPDFLPVPKDKLQRILANLIDNAVQYSPEGGTISLFACLEGQTLKLSIQDEGNGFSNEALLFATDEFYRSDQSRGSKEHFGLGLAIIRQIVTDLKGTLSLENVKGKGALVTVRLPLIMLRDS